MLKEIHEQPESLRQCHRRPGDPRRTDRGSRSSRASRRPSARSTGSSSSPAAAPRTPRSSAPRPSRTGSASRPGRRSARSSATARRRSTAGPWSSPSPSPARRPTRSPRPGSPASAARRSSRSRTPSAAPSPARRTAVLFLQAGPEIAVAASKTFVAQVTTLVILAAAIAKARGALGAEQELELGAALHALPAAAARALENADAACADLARRYVNSRGFMFVGRGYTLPDRARGRAQAQGGQLRPRRGLRRRAR